MGIRQRLEQHLRAALHQAEANGGQVNRAARVNAVVARNSGGGSAAASAEQTAPIFQDGRPDHADETDRGQPGGADRA